MRIRFSLLKEYLREAALMTHATSRSAPTDPDAQTPGHLPEEVPSGVDETDDRMEGDGQGNGMTTPEDSDEFDMADHLRSDKEKTSLGNPPDETIEESLNREISRYFIQEGPAGAGMVDPTDTMGFYTPFDMTKDHTGTDDLSSTWYKSPGREPGTDGDPFRGEDPHAQLGFHPPAGDKDPVNSPPSTRGEEGAEARRAPPIWQLSAGSNTSKVLSADAKPDTGGEESEGEPSEDGEEGEGGEGASEGSPPEGEKQS